MADEDRLEPAGEVDCPVGSNVQIDGTEGVMRGRSSGSKVCNLWPWLRRRWSSADA